MSDFRDRNRRILLGLVDEAGLRGGLSSVLVRPRLSNSPLTVVALISPLLAMGGALPIGVALAWTGGASSIGESGGGGILVPSVRLKFMGASAGSSKRPLGLPLTGIVWLG